MVSYWELKLLVLDHYGKSCIYCNEDDPKKIHVVFKDPGMQNWRAKFGLESTEAFYRYLYRRDFPDKFKKPGKYRLVSFCKKHHNEFVSAIRKGKSRSEETKAKISKTMRSRV